eukprot:gb/GFBE01005098.1/.p1 GENE.gb/GFBE01005098.1/~~gb/GFBE01005098.1/.p1  ORF type:complete len:180 (+),score=17.96 gb/GFBE01005098.1/:1-540(+)
MAEQEDDDDDPLGIFQPDESPPRWRPSSEDDGRWHPSGDSACWGSHGPLPEWPPPADAPDTSKYWARDSAGRLYRLPFRPSEADLEHMRDLDRRIEDFVRNNGLADKVARIIHNMMPYDAETLMSQAVDLNQCRSPTAVVISRIRRIETCARRPNAMKRYDRRYHGGPSISRSRSPQGR